MELRIFDLSDDEKTLIDFNVFLRNIIEIYDISSHKWEITEGAYGYGKDVCSIEDELEENYVIKILPNKILPSLIEGKQYFDNVVIKLQNTMIEFGIIDSTFYFVKGDKNFLKKVSRKFNKTEILIE